MVRTNVTDSGEMGRRKVRSEPSVSAFEMPGHLLRRCHQIAVGIFLEECRPHDLTPLQFVALATLSEKGPMDQAALGRVAALDRTTSAIVIRALAERGLVTRAQSQKDKRSKVVTLTNLGRDLLANVRADIETAQERIVSPLSMRERDQLNRLLEKVAVANNEFSRAPQFDC